MRGLYVVIAFVAVFASLTVASKILGDNSFYTTVAAYLAALSSGLLASFNISEKSNNVKSAWRLLKEANMKYGAAKNSEIDKLIDAWSQGEKLIGDITVKIEKKP